MAADTYRRPSRDYTVALLNRMRTAHQRATEAFALWDRYAARADAITQRTIEHRQLTGQAATVAMRYARKDDPNLTETRQTYHAWREEQQRLGHMLMAELAAKQLLEAE